MKVRFKLTQTPTELASEINKAIARTIDKAAQKINPDTSNLAALLISKWKNSSTYASLVYGDLNGKIGFPAGTAKDSVDNILEEAAKSIRFDYQGTTVYSQKFKTTIKVYILKEDLFDVLQSIDGLIETEKDQLLHWTDWLLTQGDRIVINGWHYYRKNGKGRSGMGIMVKKGVFRIPSMHSGVLGDNWLTRVIEQFVIEISRACKVIIDKEIKRNL